MQDNSSTSSGKANFQNFIYSISYMQNPDPIRRSLSGIIRTHSSSSTVVPTF